MRAPRPTITLAGQSVWKPSRDTPLRIEPSTRGESSGGILAVFRAAQRRGCSAQIVRVRRSRLHKPVGLLGFGLALFLLGCTEDNPTALWDSRPPDAGQKDHASPPRDGSADSSSLQDGRRDELVLDGAITDGQSSDGSLSDGTPEMALSDLSVVDEAVATDVPRDGATAPDGIIPLDGPLAVDIVLGFDGAMSADGKTSNDVLASSDGAMQCVPGSFLQCASTSLMLMCNSEGSGTVLVDCAPFLCDSANQRCGQCDPLTAPTCNGDLLVICSEEGLVVSYTCPDGCVNGACSSCVPSAYYRDFDNDGYGDLNVSVNACSQPVGYVLNSLDCDDLDPAAHPGQTAFFNLPTKGTGDYDYNCDDLEEKQFPSTVNCVVDGITCTGDGWVGEITACGVSGIWAKCNKQGRGVPGCGITSSQKIQSCHKY
jgi:hypothetical protein